MQSSWPWERAYTEALWSSTIALFSNQQQSVCQVFLHCFMSVYISVCVKLTSGIHKKIEVVMRIRFAKTGDRRGPSLTKCLVFMGA